MNDISIRPRTLDFISFVNWAIKNIPGEYPIYLDYNKEKCNCIEIGDIVLYDDTFVCASINEVNGCQQLELEYFKTGPCASRTYTKRIITESADWPYKMFTPTKFVLDPMPV